MRIRTFEPFWLVKNGILNSYPMLTKNLDTEIVVIGGGITGALVSHALMEAGHQVILIDKRDIGQGSTSATTSMLQYEIDEPLINLADMIGEKEAAKCYKAGIKAIKELDKLVNSLGLDCGFEKKKSLYLAHNEEAAKWLKVEYNLRSKYKMGVKWLDASQVHKLYGLHCFGAIQSNTAASVDAYRLAHGLIAYNCRRGMQVYDQTQISDFDFSKKGVTLQIEGDYKVKCNKVVFCTGFESTSLLSEKIAKLFYTYATVSEQNIPLVKQLKDVLVWDTDTPYIYMRTTQDGRLLVGGEDSSVNFQFFQQVIKKRKERKLIEKLNRLIPDNGFISDFSWAGTFGSTKDGLPYIGASPEYKNAFFVLGFGGNGITFSIQAMEMIPRMLKGRKHPLQKYYRFGR